MDTIGAFEAKTHFASLPERVARGATVTITRHGMAVARLVPVESAPDRASRAQAIARIKEIGRRHTLGGLDWRKLRDEGRR